MGIRFCKGDLSAFNFEYTLNIDKDLIKKAHNIFLENDLEYIPIFDKNGKYFCCCYDDKNLDKTLKYLQIMMNSAKGLDYFNSFGIITLVSCNEIGIQLYELLKKTKCKVYCIGELWTDIYSDAEIINHIEGFGIYCEGNPGFSLNQMGTWKTTFPFNEFEFIEDKYRELSRGQEMYDKKWVDKDTCNRLLINKILSGKPFMAARLGNSEASICREYMNGYYSKKWLGWLFNATGFFSEFGWNTRDVDSYVELTFKAISKCDVHCCRFDNEIGLVNNFGHKESINVDWYDLYSNFDVSNLWLTALENKKVLIISSVNQTIQKQLKIRNKLFDVQGVLPESMNTIFYDAPQTQLGEKQGFKNWFEAYDKVVKDIKNIDFDIAIIAAGAYGYPLAAEIKNMGKQSIELCSGIYPVFGIKVKTQLIIRKISSMYNDNWIFPIETPPKNYMNIEKGAYWE